LGQAFKERVGDGGRIFPDLFQGGPDFLRAGGVGPGFDDDNALAGVDLDRIGQFLLIVPAKGPSEAVEACAEGGRVSGGNLNCLPCMGAFKHGAELGGVAVRVLRLGH
jgi:hypothetical protein